MPAKKLCSICVSSFFVVHFSLHVDWLLLHRPPTYSSSRNVLNSSSYVSPLENLRIFAQRLGITIFYNHLGFISLQVAREIISFNLDACPTIISLALSNSVILSLSYIIQTIDMKFSPCIFPLIATLSIQVHQICHALWYRIITRVSWKRLGYGLGGGEF